MLKNVVVLLAAAAAVQGQTVTGTLEGHITDATVASVPGAEITAVSKDTGLTRRTVSNQEGYYQLTFLPVGDYSVSAQAQGFATSQRRAVVELSSTRAADFQLKPAAVATEITVTDEAALIETSRGEVKSTIDERAIEDRPLSSRNILSLVEQLPGFQSSGGFSGVNNPALSSGSYVAFNGTGSRSATFQVDGVNNDDASEGTNRQNVNVSAIREFQVLTNAYSAEFGRAGGAIVLVQTKSGTNRFHGDAYEFMQNDKLNSNGFFNNAAGRNADGAPVAPRAAYRRNQFGYTAGGPILHNKLFFFHSLEQTRLLQYSNSRVFLLPITRIQIGDCRLCVNPEQHPNLEADVKFLQTLLDRYPKVQPNARVFCEQCFIGRVRHNFPDQDYSGKFDWNVSSKDMSNIRYQYSRQRRTPGELIVGTTARQNNRQQALGVTETHVFSPRTTGEFRFGLALRTTLVDPSTGVDTPIVQIANPSTFPNATIGSAGQFPIHRYQTDYQFNYNLAHLRGTHVIKVGTDSRRQHLDDLADNYSRGYWRFSFTGISGTPSRYEGWENLLRGYATSFEKGYGNFTTYNRLGEVNLYALDDWKVRPTFTLNLGFRMEYVRKPAETNDRILYNYGDFTGWQPRLGFAWSPRATSGFWSRITGGPGRMSIRGGGGLYHNRIFQSVFSQGAANLRSLPPYGIYRGFEATYNVSDPTGGFTFDPNGNYGRITIAQVAPDLRMPAVQQYNLTTDRQLPGAVTISVSYNRTRAIGLLQNAVLNRARFPFTDPATGITWNKVDPDLGNTTPAPGFISQAQPRTNSRRPDPRYGTVYYIHNGAWSYYNGMRLEVRKRYSKGVQASLAYAFSKTIDTGSDVTQGNTLTEFGSARSLRGLSDFDQRHRLNLNYSCELPWFRRGRGLARQTLGGWKISGNNTFASGNPFNVTAGYDVNADGLTNDRPILLDATVFGRSVDNGRRDEHGVVISTLQLPAAAFFPTVRTPQRARFFDPGGSGSGSIGRNVFFGSGIRNWDLGLHKSFAMPREGHELTFRAEAYNLTNTPRFAFPTRDLQSANFGVISSTYNPMNFVGAARTDDTSRVIQLGLRYRF
ncbi:MAG TPA: carboxypeptidase regulatory-like domain-containing protein [Bryobacteraceae bacterium]|nr:carboxypeptidase regulatory-like domain-containing protein [Bryobacteraceae bacterium]